MPREGTAMSDCTSAVLGPLAVMMLMGLRDRWLLSDPSSSFGNKILCTSGIGNPLYVQILAFSFCSSDTGGFQVLWNAVVTPELSVTLIAAGSSNAGTEGIQSGPQHLS